MKAEPNDALAFPAGQDDCILSRELISSFSLSDDSTVKGAFMNVN